MKIDIDKKIENELKRDIEIPQSVLNKINKAFDEIRVEEPKIAKSIFKFNKKLIASLIIVFAFGIITINPKVIAGINSFLKDRGVQKAANNGYIQALKGSTTKDNGVSINIDDVVKDKTKIAISFTFKFDDINNLKNISDIQLGLNIKDNNDRIIFEHLQEGISSPYSIGIRSNIDKSNIDNGEIKYYLTMYSTNGTLDNINNLSINIDKIKLYEEDVRYYTDIEGEWNLLLDLYSKIEETETIKYVLENSSDIVSLNSIEVMPTGSIINMSINKKVDENIINRIVLTDESGENIYNVTSGNMEDTESGVNISFMYDLTTFDNLDRMKIIIKNIDDEDIVLNLVKEDN